MNEPLIVRSDHPGENVFVKTIGRQQIASELSALDLRVTDSAMPIHRTSFLSGSVPVFTACLLSLFGCSSKPLPLEVQPGVRMVQLPLHRSLFLEDQSVGVVSDIKIGRWPGLEGEVIVCAGNKGVVVTDDVGKVLTRVKLADMQFPQCKVRIVQDGDGTVRYILRGGEWTTPPQLFTTRGELLWTFDKNDTDSVAAADIDQDGHIEFVIGGLSGLYLVNDQGRVRWRRKDGPASDVGIVTTATQGSTIVTNTGGDIVYYDPAGRILSRRKPSEAGYMSSLLMIPLPGKPEPGLLVGAVRGYPILSLCGEKSLGELRGPYADYSQSVILRASSPDKEFLVLVGLMKYQGDAIVGFVAVNTHVVIYDDDLHLVYDEILSDRGTGVAALRSAGNRTDRLLVGGDGRMWCYALGPDRPTATQSGSATH